jgi:hypothetical protein
MFNDQVILENVFAIGTPADWHIGLYLFGEIPYAGLSVAEIPSSRASLAGKLAWDTDHLANNSEVFCGPLPSCTIGGWFITPSLTSEDVTWVNEFVGGVAVTDGDHLNFAIGTINLDIG